MRTVHLIFNAHLDPVWLWPWSSGLDEIINTCASVCDLLDRHPTLIFTRGEAWVYEHVERIAPKLFQRIVRHVRAGRWEIVGGWYVQPDCNLPGRIGLDKQIQLGRAYFQDRFGQFPRIAYNVDSFGHAATLPDIMRDHGQTCYVMMRPQEHERDLPARLFRWRGPSGGEVSTFRISPEYCTPHGISWDHIEKSLTALPKGVSQTMCFVGVGDHGGGPTETLVQWCIEQRAARADVRLVFSSPSRFFRAVARSRASWPVVTGELQHHAIGCYSVHRPVKRLVRAAERLLDQADRSVQSDRALARETAAGRAQAWRWTCFNAFHDTLGGTCLPSAYRQMDWQLGHALATADDTLTVRLRRIMAKLPPAPHQRIVVANFSAHEFHDYIEHEPWLEWTDWSNDWVLLDEKGRSVPFQLIQQEALRDKMVRLLFRLRVGPNGIRVLRIAAGKTAPIAKVPAASLRRRANAHLVHRGSEKFDLPVLQLREEPTDTWAHGIHSYDGTVVASAEWEEPLQIESGPLMLSWQLSGRIGESPLVAEWRIFPAESFVELRLRVDWRERHRALQLRSEAKGELVNHIDGIPGGELERRVDGRERPIRDFVLGRGRNGERLAVACPEVYSASADRRAITLTLLRACLMAHHDPYDGKSSRRRYSDRGEHEFRLRFWRGRSVTTRELDRSAAALVDDATRQGDLTIGMPLRALRGELDPLVCSKTKSAP